jgi:hypothetical protein
MKVEFSKRHRFADWPNSDVPRVAAGVYLIWDGDELIYCGMSGRGLDRIVKAAGEGKSVEAASERRRGLTTRLRMHHDGRLSGDQFCVYVANRLVIPSLKPSDLPRFHTGELTLDQLTKEYIHRRLEYQFAVVETEAAAYELERACCNGVELGVKPLLNPR